MSTVITWGNSEGTKGRCDAKCHNAAHPDCQCMCGGRYHGAGLKEGGVEKVMQEYQDKIIDEAKKMAESQGYKLEVNSMLDLFGFVSRVQK